VRWNRSKYNEIPGAWAKLGWFAVRRLCRRSAGPLASLAAADGVLDELVMNHVSRSSLMLFVVLAVACGSSESTSSGAPANCSGTTCSCTTAGQCNLSGSGACTAQTSGCVFNCESGARCTGTCGGSCNTQCGSQTDCTVTAAESANLTCNSQATCSLTAKDSASVSCASGSHCQATVGAGSSVSCASGATCTVTCTSTCSAVNHGGTLTIRCASDPAAQAVDQSRQCQ